MREKSSRSRDDRGAALVFVAIGVIAFVGVAGLIVDGSRGYSHRRQMQNAADAGALAGASTFNRFLRGEVTAADVGNEAIGTALQNGATSATCAWVAENGAELASCSNTSNTYTSVATGVRVHASGTIATSFASVLGKSSLTANADATAQVLAVRAVDGEASPWVACAFATTVSGPSAPLVNWVGGEAEVNMAARGKRIEVHAPSIDTMPCGGTAPGFKGWVDPDGTYTIPGVWQTQTGTRSGPARQVLAGVPGCTGDLKGANGCYLALPICTSIEGNGASVTTYCVGMGLFQVYDTGSGHSGNAHEAVFVGPATLTGGTGGGRPSGDDARVIRLTD